MGLTFFKYGSDSLLPVKFLNSEKEPTAAILTLALGLKLPLERAKSMALLLLKLGATSSQADLNGCTAFHRYVENANPELIDVLWDNDKTGVKTAINHLVMGSSYWNAAATAPLHTAIGNNDSILVMKLLSAGAKPDIDFEMWLKAAKFSPVEKRLGSYEENKKMYSRYVEQPLMIALKSCPDPTVALRLLEAGADPNSMTPISHTILTDTWQRRYNSGQTALNVVQDQLASLRKFTAETVSMDKPSLLEGMDEYLEDFEEGSYQHWLVSEDIKAKRESFEKDMKAYNKHVAKFMATKGLSEKKAAIKEVIEQMEKVEKLIIEKGGKSFYELHPDIEAPPNNPSQQGEKKKTTVKPYEKKFVFTNVTDVTEIRMLKYIEL